MNLSRLNRRIHYWASIAIAAPVLIIFCSGILLQMKKHWSWVQPKERRGASSAPAISLDDVLASVTNVRDLGVSSWSDVNRIDVRPSRGIAKVWLHSGWEVQVDLATGDVLQSAYRRSDLIESIHDGSYFGGDLVKLGLFLPTALTLLILWGTGLWLFYLPFSARRRRRAQRQQPAKAE